MKTHEISRRLALKGLGSITIGLPFLEEMGRMQLRASETETVPERAFNLFFGLGIPAPLQKEGFDGVLEPLRPLRDQLLILRQVDQMRCDESGINAHFDGASGAFTAEPPQGEAKAGGPSLDQLVRQHHYPQGQPAGVAPTVVAGTFFRRSRVSRYVHSYREDGTVAATVQERPRDLFDRVFGAIQLSGTHDARQTHLKRSVLDSVVEQYRFYTGARSPLGKTSRAKVQDHLDRIREFEQRAFSETPVDEAAPARPTPSPLLHGGLADPGGEGIDITLEALSSEWRLMADLYATAIRMDKVRFGSLTFLAAGERIRLTGDYLYQGEKRYTFDDARRLNAGGSQGCSHEWWHQFNEKKGNEALRAHAHMKMRELAYFLKQLAAPDSTETNGKSILENSLITISTESGDGRHNDVKRELSGVFHAVTGARGRFRTGQIMDVGAEGLDVYNTLLSGMGVTKRMGPEDREHTPVDAIRA
jgi:hypothetical protein